MAEYYFHVVKHFPPRTTTYLSDYSQEVLQVACWIAGKGVKRISRPTTISDDSDRTWVIVCVMTNNKTKLNFKYISYDGDGNFEDVSDRFTQNSKRKWTVLTLNDK